MILTDKFLEDLASAYGKGSYDQISHLGFSNQDTAENATQLSLSNEIGQRSDVTVNSTSNQITLNAIRPTTDVVDTTNGDIIESVGHFIQSSGGDLRTVADTSSINQTIDFDLEIDISVDVKRK